MDTPSLISAILLTPDCTVHPPKGLPMIEERHVLPNDVQEFYQLCGGVDLFESSGFSISVVPPEKVVVANPVIVGVWSEDELRADSPNDMSWSWYIIAEGPNSQYITIDFDRRRLGYCYDSFWDVHPRDSKIIAKSFTDLVSKLVNNRGQHWYWLKPEFESLGSPYELP
jgi:antitoxin YokJ